MAETIEHSPTKILYGDRELIVSMVPAGTNLVSLEDDGIEEKRFESLWRQRSPLRDERVAFLNPPNKVPKDFKSRDGYLLLFEENARFKDGIPAEWSRWAKVNAIEVSHAPAVSNSIVFEWLTTGVLGVTFTKEAADWYTRVVGTSPVRVDNEVGKLLYLGYETVDLEAAALIIGGAESLKAERVFKSLGTKESLKLGLEMEPAKAIQLMGYLMKALEYRRSSWLLALYVVKKAGMDKVYDFATAVHIFLHFCYQAKQHPGQEHELMLQLMKMSGMVRWYIPEDYDAA